MGPSSGTVVTRPILRYTLRSMSAAVTSASGFFAELKEIEDAYNVEMLKLKRKQAEALRRIEHEKQRKEVEDMKSRIGKSV